MSRKHGLPVVARIGGGCLSSRVLNQPSSCISGHLSQSVTGTDKASLFQGHDYWATSISDGLVGRPNVGIRLLSGDGNKPGADDPANGKPYCVQSRKSPTHSRRPCPTPRLAGWLAVPVRTRAGERPPPHAQFPPLGSLSGRSAGCALKHERSLACTRARGL